MTKARDIADLNVTILDSVESGATADQTNAEIRAAVEAATDSNVFTDADHTKLNAIEASADVTDTTNVTAAGALMDSELTSIASVKALNQGVATGDSPTFAAVTSTGEITANGGIALGDNDKATFGAGDLQIYHDGTNSYIKDDGNGDLIIQAYDDIKFQQSTDNASLVTINTGGNVTIHSGKLGIGTSTPRSVTNYSVVGINGTSGSAIDFELGEALKTTLTQTASQFEINVVPALPLIFKTSNTERLKIDSDGVTHFNGDVKVLSGDIQMGSGRGINFSPNSNAGGMTSETLSDFEQGNWTPVIRGNTPAPTGQSYVTQNGRYTKIGRLVTLEFDVILSAKGTVGGSYLIISGVPFSPDIVSYSGTTGIYFESMGVSCTSVVASTGRNDQIFIWVTTAAQTSITRTNPATNYITDDTRLVGSVTFSTS